MAAESELGPVFSPTGPDAALYGAAEGFPTADRSLPIQPGNVPAQISLRRVQPFRRDLSDAADQARCDARSAVVEQLGQR
jgi:hypothetical protein